MLFRKKNIISSNNSGCIPDYIAFKTKQGSSKTVCHAPFTSMRFTISGNIQACCFNRLLLLGKYPENKLIEIWKSENSKTIRKAIKNNDLGFGCGYCSEVIKTGNFGAVGAQNYDYIKFEDSEWPTMLDFELGNNCNLECIMCNGENSSLIRQNREKETPYKPPYDNEFVKQLEPFIPHLKEARFVGGEPFLIEINYSIWEKIIEINPTCNITILTNGTILNERIKSLISRGNFNISVSSDGISKEIYEKIRMNADYSLFMKNLLFFLDFAKQKKNTFTWNFCPQRLNWKEIPEVFNFCNKENIKLISHTIVFPPHTALWNLEENELEKINNFLIKNKPSFRKLNKIEKENSETYQSLLNQMETWLINSRKLKEGTQDNNDELKTIFYSKISSYINESKVFSTTSKQVLVETYIQKLNKIFELLDEKSLRKVLSFMISFNIELIVAEMENSSDEKLKQRILTAAN